MPLIRDNRLYLLFLLLILPAQYIITIYFDASPAQKYHNILEIKSTLLSFTKFLEFESWRNWCSNLYGKMGNFCSQILNIHQPIEEQSQALKESEIASKKKMYYFTTSPEPRSPRPEHLVFRIGQVVRHRSGRFRGIIFGWDEKTLAPMAWMYGKYGTIAEKVKDMPSYALLVDARDEARGTMSYVKEDDLEAIKETQILNDEIGEYFESFDGNTYIPRPKLRKIYPHD